MKHKELSHSDDETNARACMQFYEDGERPALAVATAVGTKDLCSLDSVWKHLCVIID